MRVHALITTRKALKAPFVRTVSIYPAGLEVAVKHGGALRFYHKSLLSLRCLALMPGLTCWFVRVSVFGMGLKSKPTTSVQRLSICKVFVKHSVL